MNDLDTRDCDIYRDRLSDLVDGGLAPIERQDLERHLEVCDACRQLVTDLRRIQQAAAALPRLQPSAESWTRLAHALASAHVDRPTPMEAGDGGGPVSSRRFRVEGATPSRRLRIDGWPALAAAAVVLIAVSTGVLWWWSLGRPAPQPTPPVAQSAPKGSTPVHAGSDELVQSIESELKLAEQHYENAIAGLEQVAKAEQSVLDPRVAATLQKNIGIIDHAIRESRAALQSQPADELAQESLFDALRHKVALLQDTIALINEMRKGNEAETARIVERFNKS